MEWFEIKCRGKKKKKLDFVRHQQRWRYKNCLVETDWRMFTFDTSDLLNKCVRVSLSQWIQTNGSNDDTFRLLVGSAHLEIQISQGQWRLKRSQDAIIDQRHPNMARLQDASLVAVQGDKPSLWRCLWKWSTNSGRSLSASRGAKKCMCKKCILLYRNTLVQVCRSAPKDPGPESYAGCMCTSFQPSF